MIIAEIKRITTKDEKAIFFREIVFDLIKSKTTLMDKAKNINKETRRQISPLLEPVNKIIYKDKIKIRKGRTLAILLK